MNVFVMVGLPVVIVLIVLASLLYTQIRRPAPVALGSALPKVRVVSSDEIHEYCDNRKSETVIYSRRDTRWKQFEVTRKYISQMTWNAKLFQQVARFEGLKIDPAKSSFDYAPRETLTLRLAEEAAGVRWLLVKGQIRLTVRAVSGLRIREETAEKLRHLVAEYKQLEQDAVALVGMATDDCYYAMLIERLGLSSWGLIEGGSSVS
jgi:hypothetical protein